MIGEIPKVCSGKWRFQLPWQSRRTSINFIALTEALTGKTFRNSERKVARTLYASVVVEYPNIRDGLNCLYKLIYIFTYQLWILHNYEMTVIRDFLIK